MTYQDFKNSLLPGNCALTKSMELTKVQYSGTLWYTKKFLVLYYYVFLSKDIKTKEYVNKVIGHFDRYIDSLDVSVREEARRFFYPENEVINFKSDSFKTFASFAPYTDFATEAESKEYAGRAKKNYFALLMNSGGQKGVKKLTKEAIQLPDYVYTFSSINAVLKNAAITTAATEANQYHEIRDRSVKHLLSEEAMAAIVAHSCSEEISLEQAAVIVDAYPMVTPRYEKIENDVVGFLRNERQIMYYYGYFHSKSLGSHDVEFSSLTPVGEAALLANAEEFLAIWEHQKLKMISQPATADIQGLSPSANSAENFAVSYTPYMDVLGYILRNSSMSLDEYKYIVSRRKHTVEDGDWKQIEAVAKEHIEDIKSFVIAFGCKGDTSDENGRKELLKYLLGLRKDMPFDKGTNPFNFFSWTAGSVSLDNADAFLPLYQVYSRLNDYKTEKYRPLFERCEADLKHRYTEACAGNSTNINARVKIDWDLYNIHLDKCILLGTLLCLAASKCGVADITKPTSPETERLVSYCCDNFSCVLKCVGLSTSTAVRRDIAKFFSAINTEDFAYFIYADEDREEVIAQYREDNAGALLARLRSISAQATVDHAEGRTRNMTLTNLLKSYYLRRFPVNGTLTCECCSAETFITEAGQPYVEFHHLIPFKLAYGPDHYLNLFALCPACHKKLHFLNPGEKGAYYRRLNRNNHLETSFVRRLLTLKKENLLRSYHLEYLLADGAITEAEYDRVCGGIPEDTSLDINTIRNTVIQASSETYLKKLPSGSIDAVITSPPYDDLRDYEGKVCWNFAIFKTIAEELYRVIKPGGVVVWVVGDKTSSGNKTLTSFKQALYFQQVGFSMYDVLIYEKTGSAPPHPNRYFNAFEYMFVLSKGKPATINLLKDKKNKWGGLSSYGEVTRREKDGTLTKKGKITIGEYGVRTNIWRYANGKGFSSRDPIAYEHPAIFPEKLVEDHILSWSAPGDLILDPFAGSGTTGKIAKELGRDYILIEAVEHYCDIARKRIEGKE